MYTVWSSALDLEPGWPQTDSWNISAWDPPEQREGIRAKGYDVPGETAVVPLCGFSWWSSAVCKCSMEDFRNNCFQLIVRMELARWTLPYPDPSSTPGWKSLFIQHSHTVYTRHCPGMLTVRTRLCLRVLFEYTRHCPHSHTVYTMHCPHALIVYTRPSPHIHAVYTRHCPVTLTVYTRHCPGIRHLSQLSDGLSQHPSAHVQVTLSSCNHGPKAQEQWCWQFLYSIVLQTVVLL
jgi:hypothetical protein